MQLRASQANASHDNFMESQTVSDNSVYLKPRPPGFKLHSYYTDFATYPIPGWRVVSPTKQGSTGGPEFFRLLHVALQTSRTFWTTSNRIVPALQMATFPYTNRADPVEQRTRITYCANHVQTRSAVWVADCEHIAAITGYYDPGVAAHWLGQRLNQRSFRALFFWSRKALENARKVLQGDFPIEKSHVVYPATFSARNNRLGRDLNGDVRICHITTFRSSQLENLANFYVKGTRDLLLMLKHMTHSAPGLLKRMVVVIRAWCPQSYVIKLRTMGVKIEMIEHTLTRPEALSYLANSDLSLIPGHSTPTMAFIEAASRGLPVITNDIWANSEYLLDGKTGFLVAPPEGIEYAEENLTPRWYRPGFIESIKSRVDNDYLARHVQILSYLIEDESNLFSLKTKTQQAFENGPFDISARNRELGRLLDEALN